MFKNGSRLVSWKYIKMEKQIGAWREAHKKWGWADMHGGGVPLQRQQEQGAAAATGGDTHIQTPILCARVTCLVGTGNEIWVEIG